MSFDTEFDFTDVLIALNNHITNLQNKIDTAVAEKTILENAPAYITTTEQNIQSLNKRIDTSTTLKTKYEETIAEITTIQNLDQTTKDTIYYFYTVVDCKKAEFMGKMLFNYSTVLSNPTVVTLQSDESTPSESKTAVANIIYNATFLDKDHVRPLSTILRNIN